MPAKAIFVGPDGLLGLAVKILREGGLIAFPTETVYGLGASALSDMAVAKIFAAKARPSFNPLIIHVSSLEAAEKLGEFTSQARQLAEKFWPGPLTLVLQRKADCPVSRLASAGLPSLAIRIPRHPLALALLKEVGIPIAAPSANISGKLSPTNADMVRASFPDILVLDGGACEVGLESTVIDLSRDRPRLLRPGGVTVEALPFPLAPAEEGVISSPGQLLSHYAPGLPIRLEAAQPQAQEAWLGFGPNCPNATLNLSPKGDLIEAAANLFAMLAALDQPQFSQIAVAPIPFTGLGLAINDRLKRAAAPRDL